MYITILICIAIIIISFVSMALFYHNKVAIKYIATSCIVTLVIEMLLFFVWPISSLCFDEIRLKVGGGTNQQDVFIKSILVQYVPVDFPVIENGKWVWLNGMYGWQADKDITDSIVLKAPAGVTRKIVFQGQNTGGLVNITVGDFIEDVNLYSETGKDIVVEIPDSTSELLLKNEVLRILVFLFIHSVVFATVWIFIRLYFEKLMLKAKKYRYEIMLFLGSIFMLVRYSLYPDIRDYASSLYFKGYEIGFVKRGIVGDIFLNISPYISQEKLLIFKLCFFVVFYLVLSICIGQLIKKQNDDKIRWFFILFILSLPSTFVFIPDGLNFDIYLFIIFAICVFLIANDYGLWLLPILIVNMLLINETSCTYFLMPVLAILLYKYLKYKRKKYLFLLCGSFGITVLICCIFLFGDDPWLQYNNLEIVNHLQNHSGFQLNYNALNWETWNISEQFSFMEQMVTIKYKGFLLFYIALLPAMILMGCICFNLYREFKQKNQTLTVLQKTSFAYLMLSPLFAFVPMIIAQDVGRYSSFMLNAMIVIIFFFIKEEKIQLIYDNLHFGNSKQKNLNIVPVAVCVFYLMFGMFDSAPERIVTVSKFVTFLSALLGL